MVLARAIDIMLAGAPASIQERKLREKSERRNEMREKRSEWGFSSKEEFRTVNCHTKITCKITQKVFTTSTSIAC